MINDTGTCSSHLLGRVLLCSVVLVMAFAPMVSAQVNVSIFPDSTAQIIRGFGAANIVGWRPDMTDDEIETAFGSGEGQLGFSILRLRIQPQESRWIDNVPTAQKAHSMGATIIASPWSPPAHMKTNGDLVGGRLRDDMYDEYAAHLDAFVTFMADNDVPIYAVSVQNEPDVEVGYESCDWTPEEMVRFMRENAPAIGTRVMAPESYQFRKEMSDPILNDPEAVENLDIVAGHIYGGGLEAYPLAQEKGKEVWMTEHLTEPQHSAEVWSYALDVGVEVQAVMEANMNAYVWWYIVRYYGPIADGEASVNFPNEDYAAKGEVTKKGYVMAHFSRFIRPGYVRVHTNTRPRAALSRVSATAYKEGSRLVVVAINERASDAEVVFTMEGGSAGRFESYVTDATREVEKLDDVEVDGDSFTVTLDARSVTTFVADDLAVSTEDVSPSAPSFQLSQNYPNPVRSATSIGYVVPRTSDVTLEVFDVLGRKVATLADGSVPAGSHRATFDASQLAGGVYIYRLRAGDVVHTRRMTVID